MPITSQGWEMHIVRESEQRRASDGRRRTVGKYQVFHDGVAQTGAAMKGTVAKSRGPGANKPAKNGKRVEEGRYPLATQDGTKYKTFNYKDFRKHDGKTKAGVRAHIDRPAVRDTRPSRTRVPGKYRLHQSLHVAAEGGRIDRLRSQPKASHRPDRRHEELHRRGFSQIQWQANSAGLRRDRRRTFHVGRAGFSRRLDLFGKISKFGFCADKVEPRRCSGAGRG